MGLTIKISKKNENIKLFRGEKFICFPMPKGQKEADGRYDAERTKPNQTINENENYGILPTKEGKNCIIDIDDKERFRPFAENVIKEDYFVSETPNGWHIPVVNLGNYATKMKLFDYKFQPNKEIIEVQGYKQYCVGAESQILDKESGKIVKYENKGSKKFWDAKGKDYNEFVDGLCKNLNVEGKKYTSASGYKHLRDQFIKEIIPSEGQSNDYFFNSALVCNTKGLSENEATEKIKKIYDKWKQSEYYSNRTFSNIKVKIRDVYKNNLKTKIGRPTGSGEKIDRTGKAKEIIETRKIYSDAETEDIYEDKKGFLENINNSLKKELGSVNGEIEEVDYKSIKWKIMSMAPDLPPTNKDLIVFTNGVHSKKAGKIIKTDDLADMGFNDYDYLKRTKENEPVKFIKLMFDNIEDEEHPRVKAALRSALSSKLDPKITVTHGLSGVGKSAGLVILVLILGEYALTLELDQLLTDHFIKAKVKNKRLLVLQDMPETYKDFTPLKTLTGEQMKTERGFHQDSTTFENKLKIWGTANYLAKIPENEKNAMYTRRLSLIHNTRESPYPEDPDLVDTIVREEGEKIISWILNLPDSECEYETSNTIRKEWESLASPEIEFLEKHYEISTEISDTAVSVMRIKRQFEELQQITMPLKQMSDALESLGYVIRKNIISNIVEISQKTL